MDAHYSYLPLEIYTMIEEFILLRIKVRYFALLRELLDDIREEEYELEDGTMLMDLLFKYIPERHADASSHWEEHIFQAEKGKTTFSENEAPSLGGYYLILINGRSYRSISQDGRQPSLKYKLKDGDEIAILPPVGGG